VGASTGAQGAPSTSAKPAQEEPVLASRDNVAAEGNVRASARSLVAIGA